MFKKNTEQKKTINPNQNFFVIAFFVSSFRRKHSVLTKYTKYSNIEQILQAKR